jgi:hypothetical protein
MTIGVIAAFLQYARRFFRPIQDLSEKYNLLQGASASSERIFRLLDTRAGDRGPGAPRPALAPARRDRVPERLVPLRSRPEPTWTPAGPLKSRRPPVRPPTATGSSRRQLPDPRRAGNAGRGRRDRGGKVDAHQPADAVLRAAAGRDPVDGVPISAGAVNEAAASGSASCSRTSSCSARTSASTSLWAAPDMSDERGRARRERVGADRFVRRLPAGYRAAAGRARHLSLRR